jgi:hypothetical protein
MGIMEVGMLRCRGLLVAKRRSGQAGDCNGCVCVCVGESSRNQYFYFCSAGDISISCLLRGRETATERKRRRTGGSSGACGIKENEKGEKERAEEAGGEHSRPQSRQAGAAEVGGDHQRQGSM